MVAAPVNNRSASLGRRGAAAAKFQKAALKSESETADLPPSDLRAQAPPSILRALPTSRPQGGLHKGHAQADKDLAHQFQDWAGEAGVTP
jgi:hypothetical protein